MPKLILSFICILLLACSNNQSKLTYLGGGIVNPKDDYVVLFKDNKIVDSIKVNQKGHFHYKFDLKEPGLFTIRHAYEIQMIFLQPKDSLQLRLNTLEFDKSLVFDGTSAAENNFLIENFLLNQENSDLILSYYKISPEDFQFKTDSIKSSRETRLIELDEKYNLNEEFIKIAQKSIDYEFYDMRERYAFLLNKYDSEKASNIKGDFFDYRKNIDFNDKVAIYLIGYQRFIDNYLKNQSIKICQQKNENTDCYNLDSYSNIDDRIKLVDSLIKDKYLRKSYFERFIQEEIIYAQTPQNLKHTFDLIEKFDFSQDDKKRLKSLVKFQGALIAKADLRDVKVKCTDLREHKLGDIMDKEKGIVYSWSVHSPSHHKLRIKEINNLKKKYPKVKFIGINIDYNFPNEWLEAVNVYNHNLNNEYIIQPEENAAFYRNYLNKIFFIDKDCIIQKSEIILYNSQLEEHIKDFVKT